MRSHTKFISVYLLSGALAFLPAWTGFLVPWGWAGPAPARITSYLGDSLVPSWSLSQGSCGVSKVEDHSG